MLILCHSHSVFEMSVGIWSHKYLEEFRYMYLYLNTDLSKQMHYILKWHQNSFSKSAFCQLVLLVVASAETEALIGPKSPLLVTTLTYSAYVQRRGWHGCTTCTTIFHLVILVLLPFTSFKNWHLNLPFPYCCPCLLSAWEACN